MRRIRLWWRKRQDRKWFNRYFAADPWNTKGLP